MSNSPVSSSVLELVEIKPDSQSHIEIKDQTVCREECKLKACTYYCPTEVYSWNSREESITVDYKRCIECLACPFGCPQGNINWDFPRGGYGIDYTALSEET